LSIHALGEKPLASITYTELETAVVVAQRIAHKRATADNRKRAAKGRSAKPDHGKGAAETAIRAARWMFERARLCGYVSSNPAADLKVPRRNPSKRRALVGDELDEFFDTVAAGGDDPDLDVMLTWFHFETGARRDGALNLTCGDLHDSRQMVRLHEKFKTNRDQPVSADLIAALRALAIERGGERCDQATPSYDPSSPVFWYRARGSKPSRRLTDRRYDTLFRRIQTTLPWADEALLTAHNLRHTGATLIERLAGTQVARRFLGHADRSVTETYTDADEAEVARAVSRLTGRPHPLAD
jgi:integrase